MTHVSFAVGAAVTRADVPVLCAELADLLRCRGPGVVTCDVTGVVRPDVVTVEALARLHLTARRYGWCFVVSGAGPGLLGLVALLGLEDVLREPGGLRQAGGETEQGEEAGGVEEAVDRGDPPG